MIKSLMAQKIRYEAKGGEYDHGINEIPAEAFVPLFEKGRRETVFAVGNKRIHKTFF